MSGLLPLNDRVIVERLESETKTASGIVIPEKAAERSSIAKVLAVGPGKLLENGTRAPMSVQKDQNVMIGEYAGTKTKIDGKDVVVLREDEILAIVS